MDTLTIALVSQIISFAGAACCFLAAFALLILVDSK